MFYLFFESRHSKSDPVVIWLTGGPGCSSELALFYENGPFVISKNLSLAWNDYGWDQVIKNKEWIYAQINVPFVFELRKFEVEDW